MSLDKETLIHALEATLVSNDRVIDRLMHDAELRNVSPEQMLNKDGTYAMAPLLHTRAMALSSLVALRTSD